jgi:Rv0078B-related antitoxin
MLLRDTSAEALTVQFEILREMTGEQRLLAALDMSLFARELSKTRIRREHPDWDERAVAREQLRLAFLPQALPAGLR